MTVYRRPDPIPLRRNRPGSDFALHAVREQDDLHRLVSRQIFAAIVAGRYLQGSILPNEELLSQELGVSRTALRESVKGLVAKGVLETRRRRGTMVRPREHWNLLDADMIGWLQLDSGRSVSEELLATLTVALFGAVELATNQRASAALPSTALYNGDMRLDARARFVVALGEASANRFITSILSTTVRGMLANDPHALEARLGWLDTTCAGELVNAIRHGDFASAIRVMRNQDAAATGAL